MIAPKYVVLTSSRHNFIWFRNPRVASRSMYTILKKHASLDRIGDLKSLTHYQSSPTKYDTEWDKSFKFGFVRNPWDRILSFYRGKLDEGGFRAKPKYDNTNIPIRKKQYSSFSMFVKDLYDADLTYANRHFRRQTRIVPYDSLDFIGRYERLDLDVKVLMDKFQIYNYTLPHITEPDKVKVSYVDYYDNATALMIYDLYRDDIETFGYTFGE